MIGITGSRRGWFLLALLGFLLVMGTIFFMLFQHSSQLRFTTVNLLEEEFAMEIAAMTSSVFWLHLGEVFRFRAGCSDLFPSDPLNSPLLPKTSGAKLEFMLPLDRFAEGANLKNCFSDLTKKYPEIKKIDLTTKWKLQTRDDFLVFGTVLVKVDVALKSSVLTYIFPRDIKIFQIQPGPVSKFTLFIRDCPDPEQFNLLEKNFQDDFGRAIILCHSEEPFRPTFPDMWRKSGWVYLGGNKVVLNLDGTHPCRAESENFIFWPTLMSGTAAEVPYACSPSLGVSKLRVRFAPIWGNEGLGKSPHSPKRIGCRCSSSSPEK